MHNMKGGILKVVSEFTRGTLHAGTYRRLFFYFHQGFWIFELNSENFDFAKKLGDRFNLDYYYYYYYKKIVIAATAQPVKLKIHELWKPESHESEPAAERDHL
jgi:hypothetical protein